LQSGQIPSFEKRLVHLAQIKLTAVSCISTLLGYLTVSPHLLQKRALVFNLLEHFLQKTGAVFVEAVES
jgi:hypothetical protein